ncbi:MAG: ribulose-phosphate 3-epimerase [Acidobacteriota bacterium]
MTLLAPSILSADFAHLADDVASVARAGVRLVHVDVMDGHFVPNLTLGPAVVRSLAQATDLFLDCHLMIENPDALIPAFVEAGAGSICVHAEAVVHLHRSLHLIRQAGARAGVAVNPATPLAVIEPVLPDVDQVLLMSVNPGFSGQQFIPAAIERTRTLAGWISDRDLDVAIEVDGGITADNAAALARAGAGLLVAGSAVFAGGNAEEAARRLIEEIAASGPQPGWVP